MGYLVDLCHAGAFSDHLPRSRARRRRLEAFLGDVRATLMATAQQPLRRPVVRPQNG